MIEIADIIANIFIVGLSVLFIGIGGFLILLIYYGIKDRPNDKKK